MISITFLSVCRHKDEAVWLLRTWMSNVAWFILSTAPRIRAICWASDDSAALEQLETDGDAERIEARLAF